MRKPFQGVANIIRFNWHFYALSFGLLFLVFWLIDYFDEPIKLFLYIIALLSLISMMVSLLVSYSVYDLSGLYNLDWLEPDISNGKRRILNIHAGFDETSVLLSEKYPNAELTIFDFYNPEKHTEISIKRARKAYPIFSGTKSVNPSSLPLDNSIIEKSFVIFSAHEIRDMEERISFFKELNRVLTEDGGIIVTEHLRDLPNFLAYTIGFFHFYSKKNWLHVFNSARLEVKKQIKITPFITTFILTKNGITS